MQPIHFPVPWADSQSTSFLSTTDETRTNVERAGFSIRTWEDLTNSARDFYRQLSETPPVRTPLGLHLVIKDMQTKGANLMRNVNEEHIAVVRCIADAV